MAVSDSSSLTDIYDCSICLCYMLDREPKILHCAHTFCQDCLKQLIQDNQICCPKCRHVTTLADNDVKKLPFNFMLAQFKELQLKSPQDQSIEDHLLCNVCDVHSALFLCKNCKISLCNYCNTKHGSVGKYEEHEIVDLLPHHICSKHKLFVNVVCMKCSCALCIKCTILDHEDHSEYFKDYWKGAQLLKDQLKELYNAVVAGIQQIQQKRADIKSEVYKANRINNDLQQQHIKLKNMLSETEDKIECISSSIRDHEVLFETFEKCLQLSENALKQVSLEKLDDPGYDIFAEISAWKNIAQKAIHETSEISKKQYRVPPVAADPYLMKPELVIPVKEASSLLREETMFQVNFTEKKYYNHQIMFVGNLIACIVNDETPNHIVCLDINGKVIKRFLPENESFIYSLGVFENKMFIAQKQGIVRLPLGYDSEKKFFPREISEYGKILPLGASTILISDWKEKGAVIEWDVIENKVKEHAKDLGKPFYLSALYTSTGPLYAVNEWKADRINIYNEAWKLVSQIGNTGKENGNFDHPHAIAVTELGTLLVADLRNNRVCHFTINGRFINNVLTDSDGLTRPHGVGYRYPYLCVSSFDDKSMTKTIKCFMLRWE